MFKKFMAVFLGAVMTFTFTAGALAEGETIDSGLKRVTQTVKNTLNIGDQYTQFSGSLNDQGYYKLWNLYWSSEGENLNVTADDNGKVLSYSLYRNDQGSYSYYPYSPSLPKLSKAEAQKIANKFLGKVLSKNEAADYSQDTGFQPLSDSNYYVQGTIKINGLMSPVNFSLQINGNDSSIANFYRSDCYDRYIGDVPSPASNVASSDAEALLKDTIKLQLQYTTDNYGKNAVLRYIPVYTGNYFVDAQTGKLSNMDDIYNSLSNSYANCKDCGGGGGGGDLSEVEQTTISDMKDVHSKEDIDKNLRSIPDLGIDSGFDLQSAAYNIQPDTKTVTCNLQYIKSSGTKTGSDGNTERQYIYKYLQVNAKTYELISVSTYNTDSQNTAKKATADKMTEKANGFLSKYLSEKYAQCAIDETITPTPSDGYFFYCQNVNGIPFKQNYIQITINPYNETVDSFYYGWTDNVTFDSAEGIITADAAKSAYIGTLSFDLKYISCPVKLDPSDPIMASYIKLGYSYLNKYLLAFVIGNNQNVSSIDAKTGKPVSYQYYTNTLTYNDINSCYGKKQIEALAERGIGFKSQSFFPTSKLTQRDMLVLLLSAVGYSFDNKADPESDSTLYTQAYSYGLITKAEKNPDKLVTRAEFVKTLIGASKYGDAAKISGIFTCKFKDANKIPKNYFNYVAIAKGLGIVKGDKNNNFCPNDITTRQDAAIILYNYMSL